MSELPRSQCSLELIRDVTYIFLQRIYACTWQRGIYICLTRVYTNVFVEGDMNMYTTSVVLVVKGNNIGNAKNTSIVRAQPVRASESHVRACAESMLTLHSVVCY